MKKILCPIDLRPDTLNALEAAAHIAAAHNIQLVLLHIHTQAEYENALSAGEGRLEEVEGLQQSQQLAMERLCVTLKETVPQLQCSAILRYGDVISTILEEARLQQANLIVMGSHGVSDITEAMDGNHPVKVIEQAPCPVLCAPRDAFFEIPAKVIYGSSMKPEDADCLQRLVAMLYPFGSRIEVVLIGEDTPANRQKWSRHEELIRSYVNYEKISFHLHPWADEVYQGLNDYRLQRKAQLLVLLTHQRNFLQRLFQKSVFKQITYFSDFPFLVFLKEHQNAAPADTGDTP
ncbi:MAG: universal stress protein [Bacteroidetes bacterium]|nr:universal stress protein [Bacteroidota bacterium]